MRIKHYIYKTTNIINGRYYIGKYSTKNLNDNYIGSGVALASAVKKYGKSNFYKEILAFFAAEKEAIKIESSLIEVFIHDPKNYNISVGPSGKRSGCKYIVTQETKNKLSKAFKCVPKKDSHKIKIKKALLLSEKANKQIRLAQKQSVCKNKKPVYQFTKKGEFIKKHASASDASNLLGKGRPGAISIKKCAKGKKSYLSAYGYIWSYNEHV